MKLVARPSFVGDEPTIDIIDKDNGNITVASDVEEDYLELFLRVSPEKVIREAGYIYTGWGCEKDCLIYPCPTCQEGVEDDDNFCSSCGQKLSWEV